MSLSLSIPSCREEKNEAGETVYTSFEIITEATLEGYPSGPSKVKRRYNDFLWLYNRLKDEYEMTKNRKDPVGVPAKPPKKKILGRFNSKFLEKRRGDLEAWMIVLALHPVWPTLKVFRMFVTEPNMLGVIKY